MQDDVNSFQRKRRSPCGLRRPLLEHESPADKVPRGNCIGASVRWDLGRARDESLRASSEAERPARARQRRTSPTTTS